ncbi:hypothetical protein SDC9_57343 [bioreactor metagenome]|uniref:Uncharacterized protein n=1 Tax=bioreactor metagenome TaxID=1076179 RepID=A0A644X4C3_9ZZZZ
MGQLVQAGVGVHEPADGQQMHRRTGRGQVPARPQRDLGPTAPRQQHDRPLVGRVVAGVEQLVPDHVGDAQRVERPVAPVQGHGDLESVADVDDDPGEGGHRATVGVPLDDPPPPAAEPLLQQTPVGHRVRVDLADQADAVEVRPHRVEQRSLPRQARLGLERAHPGDVDDVAGAGVPAALLGGDQVMHPLGATLGLGAALGRPPAHRLVGGEQGEEQQHQQGGQQGVGDHRCLPRRLRSGSTSQAAPSRSASLPSIPACSSR